MPKVILPIWILPVNNPKRSLNNISMKKIKFILKEMTLLIKKHKYKIIAPILIILAVLAFLVYYIGPAVIVSFIYAGI